MTQDIRVVIADDHEIVRAGLRMMLTAQEGITIVGEAESGRQAVELAEAQRPDVVLMDLTMPDMNGIEATRHIVECCPETRVLALTIHEDEAYFFRMLDAGAMGYIPKRAAPTDLIHAIEVVHAGQVYLDPSLATTLVSDYVSRLASGDDAPPIPDLTPREHEVLTLIAEGAMNRDIAEQLSISVKTVERHRENIMNKLNLHSRTELVKYAIRKGLIELD
jgi:two-component system response regulator NreC